MLLIQIIQHTPLWVFGLFALLLWLGVKQLSTRTTGLPRTLAMGGGMAALSIYGAISAFGASALALTAWALAAAVTWGVMFSQPLPRGTRFDAWQGVFTIPGSWKPLALIMSVFATKYTVGVALAMHPELAANLAFSAPVAALYGFFTGVFSSKSVRLWRLAQSTQRSGGALSA